MSDVYLVKPDGDFLQRVVEQGGEDVKKCYQCATCSVVCDLSDGPKPFPRKEMIWTQWGLKDKLVADPDVWLCHRCNDCSTKCPRGARPGDVLAALRHETVQHYAVPQAFGRLVNQVKFLPVMLLIPVVLLTLALLVFDPVCKPVEGVLQYLHHEGFYSDLFPHWLLIGFYSTFWGLAMLGAMLGLVRFWRAMKDADKASGGYTPKVGIVASVVRVLSPVFSHGKFSKCASHASQRWAHLGAFYGFVALFLVSAWAVVALYMINPFIPGHENDLHYPFAFTDPWGSPWKILANAGCVVLIVGCVMAIRDRLNDKKDAVASSSFDWIFVWSLLAVGVTGLLTEILRFVADRGVYGAEHTNWTGLEYTAYAVYFVHLVVVFHLLVYLPYSKFAHILYRTVALVYAEHSGRNEGRLEKT